jgi:hypothetical protein
MVDATIPQERCDFYVYVIFRPDDGTPCYVGKGRGDRYRRKRRNNHRLQRLFEKYAGDLPVIIVRSALPEKVAFEIERAFIAAIGRGRRGPLVNMTDGGEGPSGMRHTEASRKKIAAGHTPERRALAAEAGRSTRGRKHSDEARLKMSISRTGMKHPPEFGIAISARLTGKPRPESVRLKVSATLTGRKCGPQSPEWVAARVESRKKTMAIRPPEKQSAERVAARVAASKLTRESRRSVLIDP